MTVIIHYKATHDLNTKMKSLDTWLITALSIGSSALLLLIILLCCCCCTGRKRSEPNTNRFRRSSSFRFNRASAPTASMVREENVETHEERVNSVQSQEMSDLLNSDNFSNATAPYPPAYSTLPSSGHRTIVTSNENTDSRLQELSPIASSNIRLERSDTTVSEVWYDASTLER